MNPPSTPTTPRSSSRPDRRSVGALAAMPQRGESSNALMSELRGSPSSPRRYGPRASAAPIPSSQSLLSPASSISDRERDRPSFTQPRSSYAVQSQSYQSDLTGYGGLDDGVEADDDLHNPDPKRGSKHDRLGTIFTSRGVINIGCLVIVLCLLLGLFAAYPIASYYTSNSLGTNGAYNLGGINSTGQIPQITNFRPVIDVDTPQSAMTRTGYDGQKYYLAFSDEFNKDGRTFYPGDDPYWTAMDIHYWPTTDFEWYDPSAITTKDGSLVITMTQESINDLNFKSGMLQSWNQMCFQYSAYIEVRVSLPGTPAVGGFWPGVWMMGNLGRPGYGATTEGTWPYTYDSCDLGTLKNQTNAAGTGPAGATTSNGNALSYLPGQRLSACTCKGEDHPGPDHTYGRGAPEIDIIEAQTDLSLPRGQVSQSAQIAPFDADYYPFNSTDDIIVYDTSIVKPNSYLGGVYQQAVSNLAYVQTANYQLTSKGFASYGFEYYGNPKDRSNGYINWQSEGKQSWTMKASAVRANPISQVGQRLISEEPMAMVINFGMSNGFQTVDFSHLTFPAQMLIDYVRVYQRPEGRMGCDPADRPTADYIARHADAYSNPNLTTWAATGNAFPKNRLIDGCSQ
ncbi:beta-glucan synthesis-associated [Dioszegia hungarica]|uniref:Beta-glucan synthesis-associated n=1 Tax=Dioszegia hungarica TaxID=4972 RepID=A0AA38H190_9TREE|nr:beta-glucan synthesis-associated [Dioszegia hungarica]KAI9631792.1 beta-glucan synthesis-associated [Dioszegia hungarica]